MYENYVCTLYLGIYTKKDGYPNIKALNFFTIMNTHRPILIIQLRPEDSVADSEYACFLKYGGLRPEDTCRMRIEKGGLPADIDLNAYTAIIIGGSPFDLTTPAPEKSAIQIKIEHDFNRLLEEVVARDFPFLGACSGNGLLGRYLGAPMSRRYREPVSLVTLDITEEGKSDKLLKGFPDRIDVLLGHKEAVDETPTGATLLMRGQHCPVQMFRVGDNIYATQFHPEGDAAEFRLRIDTYLNHGYFAPEEADALKDNVSQRPTPYAQDILKRFVDYYYHHAANI